VEKETQGPGTLLGPQKLENPHGENNATAGAAVKPAAPSCWTPNNPAARVGSSRNGTVVGNEDVDARKSAEIGCCHEDDKLFRADITTMSVQVTKGVPRGQEAREKQRDETVQMDGGGLEALHHADTKQKGE
jgi:hypothetical protein